MIIAIESSCDDSAIALISVESNKIIFHQKITQTTDHSEFGGVVPELAARLHAENLPKILEQIREKLPLIRAVAVTNAPGLTVALAEGVIMAQALCLALKVPLIEINHLRGHLYSLFIDKETTLPISALIVSGGHTMIVEADQNGDTSTIASSIDDSLGEAFDKVAKMMGLGYPGGPIIEELAKRGDENRFDFPVPLINDKRLAFSYSGLKNSVRLAIAKIENLSDQDRCDISASFQKRATDHLLHKTKKYLKEKKPARFGIVGGVSANNYIREKIGKLCADQGCELLFAPLEFCSDNAAMIARYAVEKYKKEDFIKPEEIKISSRAPL